MRAVAGVAPVPEGLEPGTPFSVGIVALAMYLHIVHASSYRRLSRLLLELFGLATSKGALDAAFSRGKPHFDADVASILARLRRVRVICSDETSVRIDGRTCWNWVFQNSEVVIHVVRNSRGAGVMAEVLNGHRPALRYRHRRTPRRGHLPDNPANPSRADCDRSRLSKYQSGTTSYRPAIPIIAGR